MDTSLVILDPGSQTFKAGFTFTYPSEEEPRLITPNAVEVRGQAPDQQTDAGAASSADVLDVIHPVQQGQIKDMDGLEALIHYSLYEMLGWEVGVEGSVLMAEPLLTSKRERELLTQLMFEVFNVYGLYFQDPATLALYALGRLTGCVVDIGHGKIDVSTVTEGQLNPTSIRRLPFAGEQLTSYMSHLVSSRGSPASEASAATSSSGPTLPPSQLSPAQAESLKEACSKVADTWYDYSRFTGKAGAASEPPPPVTYDLPDGQKVTIGAEGYQVGEALLEPGTMTAALQGLPPGTKLTTPGLVDMMAESASSALDLFNKRAGHLDNILVCGAGGCIPGLPQRLVRELHHVISGKVNLVPIPDFLQANHTMRFAPWIGGAVLSKVLAHQSHFVSRGEYEEWGPSAMARKCA